MIFNSFLSYYKSISKFDFKIVFILTLLLFIIFLINFLPVFKYYILLYTTFINNFVQFNQTHKVELIK